jgi:hypothetical protein
MNDGFDVDGVSKQQLTDLVNDSLGSELSDEKKGSNVSNLQSKSDSIPINQSNPSVIDRTPQTSVTEAGKAIPTQDLRPLDQSDPAKVFKAQTSKDPISQSLASSEQSATQSGPDRRSIPVCPEKFHLQVQKLVLLLLPKRPILSSHIAVRPRQTACAYSRRLGWFRQP